MSVFSRLIPLIVLVLFAGDALGAGPFQCPDLSSAKRVGACPSNEELRHTFKRVCTDLEREEQGTSALYCGTFEEFVAEKYKVMSEIVTPAGTFDGYLSCSSAPSGGAESVQVECGTKGCVVHCGYAGDRFLTLHTGKSCHIDGRAPAMGIDEAKCGPDGSGCAVRCE